MPPVGYKKFLNNSTTAKKQENSNPQINLPINPITSCDCNDETFLIYCAICKTVPRLFVSHWGRHIELFLRKRSEHTAERQKFWKEKFEPHKYLVQSLPKVPRHFFLCWTDIYNSYVRIIRVMEIRKKINVHNLIHT